MADDFYIKTTPSINYYSGGTSGTEPDMREELINTFDGTFPEIAKAQPALLRRMRTDSNGDLIPCGCVDAVTNEPDKDRFCPICVKRDSQIPTLHGIKKIQDIIPGEYVLTERGGYNLVTDINGRIHTKEMVSVISKGRNNIPLEVTSDHLVAIFRPTILCHQKKNFNKLCIADLCGARSCSKKNKETIIPKIEWIEARSIKVGDYVICPVTSETNPEITNIALESERFLSKKGIKPIIPTRNIAVDSDLMFFLGMYVAEGSGDAPSRKSRTAIFTLHQNEINIATKLIRIAKDKFGLQGQIKNNSQGSKSIQVLISNSILSRWLHDLCGRYSDNKYIPEFIWLLGQDLQSEFIKAFMLGDGHRDNQNWETTGVVSQRLAEEIYLLALQLNYNPSISFKPAYKSQDGQYHSDSWYVSWLDSLQKGERPQSTKWRDRFIWDNKIFSRVVEINKKEDVTAVYDLTVEENHSFVANGVLVHNCYGEGFLWDEENLQIYRILKDSDINNAVRNTLRDPGLINAILVVFYIRYDSNITRNDKIIRLVLDEAGDAVQPYKRQGIYRISTAWDYRCDNGKLEYWKVFTHEEKVKYLNTPSYEDI